MNDDLTSAESSKRVPIEIAFIAIGVGVLSSLLQHLYLNAMAGGWGWASIQTPWARWFFEWTLHLLFAAEYGLPCAVAAQTALLFWCYRQRWVRLAGVLIGSVVFALLRFQPGYWILAAFGAFTPKLNQGQISALLQTLGDNGLWGVLFLVLLAACWRAGRFAIVHKPGNEGEAKGTTGRPRWQLRSLMRLTVIAAVFFACFRWLATMDNSAAGFRPDLFAGLPFYLSQIVLVSAATFLIGRTKWAAFLVALAVYVLLVSIPFFFTTITTPTSTFRLLFSASSMAMILANGVGIPIFHWLCFRHWEKCGFRICREAQSNSQIGEPS